MNATGVDAIAFYVPQLYVSMELKIASDSLMSTISKNNGRLNSFASLSNYLRYNSFRDTVNTQMIDV